MFLGDDVGTFSPNPFSPNPFSQNFPDLPTSFSATDSDSSPASYDEVDIDISQFFSYPNGRSDYADMSGNSSTEFLEPQFNTVY